MVSLGTMIEQLDGMRDTSDLTAWENDFVTSICRDEKWRAVEPGTFPLAHGVSARVGRLREYGSAINPEVAARFIEAYLASAQGCGA